jgi:DNA-binding IclR family transcriptional regulator
MTPISSGISTLDRVCAILNSFKEEARIQTLTEICRQVSLPKSSTHRLLEALELQGLITKENNGYRLGFQLIRWGNLALSSVSIRNVALPILQSLTGKTGETSVLSIRDGKVGSWIEMVESPQSVRIAMRIGKPLYLHAGASSKVLLAFLDDDEITRVLNSIELVGLMPNTITRKDDLWKEIREIRGRGYAISVEETDPGAMGIAAPVFDHNSRVICAIGIVAPVVRIAPQVIPDFAEFVLSACKDLSKQIGLVS